MIIRESEFSEETIAHLIKIDSIGRNQDIERFLAALNTIEGSTFLSVDAKWGAGKTVFVKQIEYLNCCNVEEVDVAQIDTQVIQEFQDKYLTFYYNAWANDHHGDPLQSILFSLIEALYSDKKRKDKTKALVKSTLTSVAKEGIKTLTKGIIDIDKIEDVNDIDDLVAHITTINERKEAVSNIISDILPQNKKLLILIDELDRCSPNFAVRMIETIKHYYNDDNIVFVLSTNNRQLVHTIKKYYGNEFDGYAYLDKFYDLIFELPTVDTNKYLTHHLRIPDDSYYVNIFPRKIAQYLDLSMREINRYYSSLRLVKDSLDSRDQDIAPVLTNYVFIPFALALKIKDIKQYDQFMSGQGGELIKKMAESVETISQLTKKISNDQNVIQAIVDTYSRVLAYDKLPYDDSSYYIKEAGERFRRIVPLIGIVGKIDS